MLVFAGRYTRDKTGRSVDPLRSNYENSYVVGAAYGRDLTAQGAGFFAGWEAGGAVRFGDRGTGELWGGLGIRHRGVPIGPGVRLRPSVTAGLSVVDRAMGLERERERRRDGDVRLLYYFAPEVAFAATARPDWELVVRLHHRSGGNRTLGRMGEGHNAHAVGLRKRF